MKTIAVTFGAVILAGALGYAADVYTTRPVHETERGVIVQNEPGMYQEPEQPLTRERAHELREMWEQRAKHAATPEERAHDRAMREYYKQLEHHSSEWR